MNIIEQTKEIALDVNGIVELTPTPVPEGVPAFNSVKIITNVPSTIGAVLEVSQNGTYSPQEGSMYNSVVVNIPSDINNQDKTVTANGIVTADLGFSGLGTVTVEVEPTEEQIAEFKAEGAEEQKAKLIETSISSNGTYEREDGYSKVTVDVQPTEEQKEAYRSEGKASQLVADKSAVAAASPIISNGTKTILDTQVVVNVPSDPAELAAKYTEGETAGKAAQFSADKLDVLRVNPITSNGVKEILGESITVNVPPDQEYLDAAKAEGKEEQLTADKAEVVSVSPIKSNGTKTILGEEVVVDVPTGGGAVQESKTVEITTSGEHTITPDEGYDGIASTTVDVKAETETVTLKRPQYFQTPWHLNTEGLVDKNTPIDPKLYTRSYSSVELLELPSSGYQLYDGTQYNGYGEDVIYFYNSRSAYNIDKNISESDYEIALGLSASGSPGADPIMVIGNSTDGSFGEPIISQESNTSKDYDALKCVPYTTEEGTIEYRVVAASEYWDGEQRVVLVPSEEHIDCARAIYIDNESAPTFEEAGYGFLTAEGEFIDKLDARCLPRWGVGVLRPGREEYDDKPMIIKLGYESTIPIDAIGDRCEDDEVYNLDYMPMENQNIIDLKRLFRGASENTLIPAKQKIYVDLSRVLDTIESRIKQAHPGDTITWSYTDDEGQPKTWSVTLPTA